RVDFYPCGNFDLDRRPISLDRRRRGSFILPPPEGPLLRDSRRFFDARQRGALFSISPEILKPIRRERRVANRRSNRLVAKIVLDRSSVPPIVGQLVAARVAKAMAADLKREPRRLASARNHALVTCHAQGREALGGEHVAPRLPLPLQAAQGAELAPTDRVDARLPALGAPSLKQDGLEATQP